MSDWTIDAADAIDKAIATARDKTVVPARAASKAIVFGLLAVLLVLPAVVLLVVALFRALTELYQGEVWASWLTLGGIFVLLGAFLWVKRNA
jgi:ATP/ADP translocase